MTMKVLTKADVIRQIADDTGLTQAQAEKGLDALGRIIRDAVDSGTHTVATGFGRFVPGLRAARTGRNPATGAPIAIPAKQTVSFRPGKAILTA
jgi:DNA-binding protein HU-beta